MKLIGASEHIQTSFSFVSFFLNLPSTTNIMPIPPEKNVEHEGIRSFLQDCWTAYPI